MMDTEQRQHCYIDFNPRDEAAFQRLSTVVDEFGRQKKLDPPTDDEYWLRYFQDADRAGFWWPSENDLQQWNSFWFSTPIPQRHGATMPTPPWDFGSMVDAILEGDYDLIGVRTLDGRGGRLEFDPHGYPYGGTGSLRALVRAFGHEITGYDDGTGFVMGDAQSPRWTPGMKPPKVGFWKRLWGRS